MTESLIEEPARQAGGAAELGAKLVGIGVKRGEN
jgi:hypothetical protein